MPLAAGLSDILDPGVVVQATEVDSIVLQERPADMRVEVLGLPAAFIAIRTERIGHVSRINDGSWKRICDYLLVTESGDRIHAVFVELKKTQTEEKNPENRCGDLCHCCSIFDQCGKSSLRLHWANTE